MTDRRLGITWPLSDISGWGVFGTYLAMNLLDRPGLPKPLLLAPPSFRAIDPVTQLKLNPLFEEGKEIGATLQRGGGRVATMPQAVILHPLGNQMTWGPLREQLHGHADVGVVFFEDPALKPEAIRRAQTFDRIIVGSSWNEHVLRHFGLGDKVRKVLQGVDTTIFHPRPRTGTYGDRFVIFSGGKLELRKGQDIVLKAFGLFHKRHPDALLAANWFNPWAQAQAPEMGQSPHVRVPPPIRSDGTVDVIAWATAHDIPADAVVDTGWLSHAQTAKLLAEVDIALFPNRAEGGTNLIAMEAMAAGVPCILSANTGHADIITGDNCFPLTSQRPIASPNGCTGDWGESSIAEILDILEAAYADRPDARKRGARGAEFIAQHTWQAQADRMVDALADLF